MAGLQKIDQTDFLLNQIDEMIADLQLRRAEVLASKPAVENIPIPKSFVGPSGRVHEISKRKN
ncbi:MAG: hypothetical protein HOE02_05735 [Candidatus Marinimicrobia bacterium]|jgi:hypothetical protein|nr:hypothetical protein [Candidatus Neomarinimicrobiota bacterium]